MKERPPGFSRSEVAITVVVVFAFLGFAFLACNAVVNRNKHLAPVVARASASRMAQAIEVYQVLLNFLPRETRYNAWTDTDGAYENCDIVKQLNTVIGRDPLLKMAEAEQNAKDSFIDLWKRPYRVVMWKEKPSDALCKYFQVYSCGLNEKWEQGQGDDLKPRY